MPNPAPSPTVNLVSGNTAPERQFPTLDDRLDTAFSAMGDVSTDSHGQRVANLPVDFLQAPRSLIRELNKRIAVDTPWSTSMIAPKARPRTHNPRYIVELSHVGVSGFGLADGELSAQQLGRPLRLVPASFLAVPLANCSHPSLLSAAQPFKIQGEYLVLPVLGDIHINGSPLSENVCADLGLLPIAVSNPRTGVTTVPRYPVYTEGSRSIMVPGKFKVPVKRTDQGFRLSSTNPEAPPAEQQASNSIIEPTGDFLQGVAVQFTGVGTPRYIAHWRAKDPDGRVINLTDYEVVANAEPGDAVWVQDQRVAGRPGIFLDLPYQHYGSSPVGGLTGNIAQVRDELLLSSGATMASVTVSHIRLIERENLEALIGTTNMTSADTGVDLKVIFDDTHRLDIFLPPADHKNGDISPAILQHFDCEREEFLQRHQQPYLTKLARTLGRNANVCLRCSLTLPADQSIEDNLGLYGGLHDSGNFIALQNRLEALPVIEGWIKAVHKVSRAAGMVEPNLSSWSLIHPFCEGLIDADWANKMVVRVAQFQDAEINDLTILIATEWVLESMKRQGRRFHPAELVSNVLSSNLRPQAFNTAEAREQMIKLAQGRIAELLSANAGEQNSPLTSWAMSDLYPDFARLYVYPSLIQRAKTMLGHTVNPNPTFPILNEEDI